MLKAHVSHNSQLGSRPAVCIVGPGWRFTSGISYYTCLLANAFAGQHSVSVIQIRQLLPRCLYPGSRRVGQQRSKTKYRHDIPLYDGVNWWWGRSMEGALRFLSIQKPDILILQWWTATVLHTYLLLALVARSRGARIVIELHEIQDTGEERFPPFRWYGHWGLRLLLFCCHGCVVHSEVDRHVITDKNRLCKRPITVVPHGPFSQYRITTDHLGDQRAVAVVKQAPRPHVTNILFFGTIRPYKGLEDLLVIFNDLDREQASGLWLTVVGETWEGCTAPSQLIAHSPYRDRITFVNDYVTDEVVSAAFEHADLVVLPYRRSSSSGPLHVAMNWGLPVVVTEVGGLPEAARGYEGAIFVPPHDRIALEAGIQKALETVGQRFADPRSWEDSIEALLIAGGLHSEKVPIDDSLPHPGVKPATASAET